MAVITVLVDVTMLVLVTVVYPVTVLVAVAVTVFVTSIVEVAVAVTEVGVPVEFAGPDVRLGIVARVENPGVKRI